MSTTRSEFALMNMLSLDGITDELTRVAGEDCEDDSTEITSIMSKLQLAAMTATDYEPPVVAPPSKPIQKTEGDLLEKRLNRERKREQLRSWVMSKLASGETIESLATYADRLDPATALAIREIGGEL